MIDISKQEINLNCESCGRKITVSLKQVANQETITCFCGTKIKLQDSKGSSKKAIRDVNKAFKDLEKTLKSFGK